MGMGTVSSKYLTILSGTLSGKFNRDTCSHIRNVSSSSTRIEHNSSTWCQSLRGQKDVNNTIVSAMNPQDPVFERGNSKYEIKSYYNTNNAVLVDSSISYLSPDVQMA